MIPARGSDGWSGLPARAQAMQHQPSHVYVAGASIHEATLGTYSPTLTCTPSKVHTHNTLSVTYTPPHHRRGHFSVRQGTHARLRTHCLSVHGWRGGVQSVRAWLRSNSDGRENQILLPYERHEQQRDCARPSAHQWSELSTIRRRAQPPDSMFTICPGDGCRA